MSYLLSEPIENLIQDQPCGDIKKDGEVLTIDVLIVGSGYGGAIAAMQLAHQHRKVFVFERGKEYTLGDFPESLGDLPGHVQFLQPGRDKPVGYPDGLFDFRVNDSVSALVGCGLGGGSLINANVAMEPGDDLYRDRDWPDALRNPDVLQPSFDAVRTLLGVQCAEVDNIAKYAALQRLANSLSAACQRAPITVMHQNGANAVGVEQKACIKCGNCVTGCNIGAKNTLAMNALPLAKERGARLFTGVTVLSVEPNSAPDGSQGWKVHFRRTATTKTVLDQEVFTLRTQVVILAAGTFGSTEILKRSEKKHRLAFSAQLGRRFSTNGDVLAFGYAQKEKVNAVAHPDVTQPWSPRSPRDIGPTITGFFHTNVDGKDGHRRRVTIEDGAIPSALAHVFGEIVTTASLAKRYKKDEVPAWFADPKNSDPNNPMDPLAVHEGPLRHSQVLLAMGDDRARWSLDLQYSANDSDNQYHDRATIRLKTPSRCEKDNLAKNSIFADIDRLFEKAEKAGQGSGFDGGDYLPNPFWKFLPEELAQVSNAPAPGGQLLTVHPLGGCPMGNDAIKGVVNHWGQVFRRDRPSKESVYEGLYVMDGAILPCSLGVNPFLTIAALAYRNVEKVAEDLAPINNGRPWSLQGVGKVRSSHIVQPPFPPPVPAHDVGTTFVEWMTGQIQGPVPQWLIDSFDPSQAEKSRRLNEKDRLVLKVRIDISNILRWLRDPNARDPNNQLFGDAWLYVNTGLTDPVQEQDLREQDLIELARGCGRVKLLEWDQPSGKKLEERQQEAIEAFIKRRPEDAGLLLRCGWKISPWKFLKWLGTLCKKLRGYLRVAKNHANWRTLDYSFKFRKGQSTLNVKGTKRLAYALFGRNNPWNNPWTAVVELPIELSDGGANSVEGALEVDLIKLTRRAPFQVYRSPNTPVAIAAMASAGMMLLRVLFQTHFWSFGAPDYPRKEIKRDRDPGPVGLDDGTVIEPDFIPLPVPKSPEDPTKTICLRLVRYQPKESPRGSILVVHGFALGSLVFATDTIDVNLVKYLCQNGYDVWLLDYRLSIALPYATQQCTMDQIARHDMAEAVRYVYRETREPIQVFVHCIGSGSMAMAILSGSCHDRGMDRSMISALATHAVHPWVVPSVVNIVKANLGAFFRDAITRETFDAVLPDENTVTATDVLMDRLAGSLPLPNDEDMGRHKADTNKRSKGKDICNRMTLFYSYEWNHSNLTEQTHKALKDLVGIANLETFRHIYLTLVRRRLTNHDGENIYVTKDKFLNFWTFPTLFAHGSDNQVYSPLSAARSYLRLRALRPSTGRTGATKNDVYWREIPNYGHMDFLFGKNAHEDVYPYLDAFFHLARRDPIPERLKAAAHELQTAGPERRPDPYWEQRPKQPTCGPIFGAVRKDGGNVVLRIWVEPFEFSSITPSGNPANPPGNIRIDGCPLPKPAQNEPKYPGTYWVYDVMVPQTFDQDLRVSVDYDDPNDIRFKVEAIGPDPDKDKELHDTSEGVRIPLARLPWFERFRQNQDGEKAAFLVGSCRYPGSPFEEDLADCIFEAMEQHIPDSEARPGIDHVLLVGDQIYADATADMFDTRELRERFAGQYRETFGAKHLRKLLASVPTYLALDDHEFDDNWPGNSDHLAQGGNRVAKKSMETFRHGLAAAKAYQWSMSSRSGWSGRPADPPRDDSGLWYTFESGGLPFFVMDTRTERRLREANVPWQQATLICNRQLDALQNWLSCVAPGKPKFIVSGSVLVPILKTHTQQECLWRNLEGWAGYPASWRALVQYIVEKQIQNVVFIGGDYHLSALARLSLKSKSKGDPVTAYQIVASGLFAPLPFANDDPQVYDWGPDTPLPFSSSNATLEYEAHLLSDDSSHFLRVDVQRNGGGWRIGTSVQTCEGVTAPASTVNPPFATGPDNVVRWDL